MNFKLFWKKTNRGLWLGLALLVGLIIFIIVSEVSFGLQKKEIRELSKEYVGDLLALNVVEGNLGVDGYLTEAQKAAQKAALDKIAQEYWYTGSVELNSSNYDLATLSENLTKWQREMPGKVTGLSYRTDDWEVDITRNGPGRVLLTLSTDEIEVRGEGAAPPKGTEEGLLFPTPVSERGYYEDADEIEAEGEEEPGDEWYRTCKIYFSLELVRRGGKWQIAGMNANVGYGYSYYYGLLGMVS